MKQSPHTLIEGN